MFDIGVNLTSTQFAKDRVKVEKRAREAGVTGVLIIGTNAQESQQAQSLWPSSILTTAGLVRVYILTMPVSGLVTSLQRFVGWLKVKRSWLSVSMGSILTETSMCESSRSMHLLHNFLLLLNWRYR